MRRESRSGILAVDKGKGVTSFQVVAHVRRLLRAPKVGHGGTLDPDATGVLPILIGEATKLTPFLAEHEKEYVAVVRLGITTDTQDLSGKTIATAPVPRLTRDEISEACYRFVGTIMQVPSMFSALHRGGRRLYELAREGIEVPREPREVTVRSIALESVALPSFTIRVTCGKGTYVRALCADIGEALGCGAALESLVRTRVGPFSIESAIPWEEIRAGLAAESLWERLLPMDTALGHWPAVTLQDQEADAFLHGRSIDLFPAPHSPFVRVYGHDNRLLAVGRIIAAERRLKPERILCGDLQRSRILPA
jgi:tRNA pseudouridine55 synthase